MKALQGKLAGSLRARVGNYRIFLTVSGATLTITGVRIRGGAYG